MQPYYEARFKVATNGLPALLGNVLASQKIKLKKCDCKYTLHKKLIT